MSPINCTVKIYEPFVTEKPSVELSFRHPLWEIFAPLFPITSVTHSDDASGLLWELCKL